MSDPVDVQRLVEFSDGTESGLRTLIDIFISDSASTLDDLSRAVADGDSDAIRLLAHRAGGSCSACGARRLSSLLLRLEHPPAAGRSRPADVETMGEVLGEFEAVERFLHAYMEGLPE